ncbi:2'-5' RNA ligase family protein [Caulobacter sp. S45]|uniref:2'-5' RNA ligase family protein n=1 Tax=Caulobacter sp. S45 TaxID=1641861 RepID=UPI001575D206|nr:2'-5' RNA ligase family protein [Caulobacter sp. S45]
MSDAPLILTLKLDPVSFARFDGLRRAHFPPALNHIPAHLTLFHKLPGEGLTEVVGYLATSAAVGPLQLRATGLRKLGRGTAFEITGAELKSFRARLAERWAEWLTPQDRQGFRPHVTVQNKVEPIMARALYDQLSDSFHPFDLQGVGVLVWRYLGGPWELEAEVGFTSPA